jgi:hypothetical protein
MASFYMYQTPLKVLSYQMTVFQHLGFERVGDGKIIYKFDTSLL